MSTTVHITQTEADELRTRRLLSWVPTNGGFFTHQRDGYDYFIVPDDDPRLRERSVDPFTSLSPKRFTET